MTSTIQAPRHAARIVVTLGVIALCVMATGLPCAYGQESSDGEKWISLFNGKDLDGWTPKVRGQEFGEDSDKTFRVEEGVIKVSYENCEKFKGEFGHLFFKESFSDYRFRVEYRFTGDQLEGGPSWAFRNSGIMIHCQPPGSMRKDQEFPVSIEVQLLGGDGEKDRTTGNLCTPGTNVVMKEKLQRRHCINSTSETYHGDQWVTAEVEVKDGKVKHLVEGDVVLEYEQPQLDPSDGDAKLLLDEGADLMLGGGYISLQSESHPVEFRKVEILPLR